MREKRGNKHKCSRVALNFQRKRAAVLLLLLSRPHGEDLTDPPRSVVSLAFELQSRAELPRLLHTTTSTMADAAPAAPAKKAPKAKGAAKKPTHPSYAVMIAQAIRELKERNGSSRQAILKYVVAENKLGDEKKAGVRVKLALRKQVQAGALKQVKGAGASGSFKLAEDVKEAKAKPAKKKVAKKPAAKKAAAKKPAAKKAAKKPAAKKAAKKPAAKKAVKKPAKKAAKKPAAKKPSPKKAAKKPAPKK